MKITIDTKEDSHSEIRKVIALLKHLIGEEAHSNYSEQPKNIFEDNSTPAVGGGMFSMFGDTSGSSDQPRTPQVYSDKTEEEENKVKFYGF